LVSRLKERVDAVVECMEVDVARMYGLPDEAVRTPVIELVDPKTSEWSRRTLVADKSGRNKAVDFVDELCVCTSPGQPCPCFEEHMVDPQFTQPRHRQCEVDVAGVGLTNDLDAASHEFVLPCGGRIKRTKNNRRGVVLTKNPCRKW
jgi:hypothetical protein